MLAEAGIGFDCASKNEIQQVLGSGVAPQRIVYAHPCKSITHLRFAKSVGVKQTVFDNEDEVCVGRWLCVWVCERVTFDVVWLTASQGESGVP